MYLQNIKTIDEILVLLENIIDESEKSNNANGYFAALYQKVTIQVKDGISSGLFDNGPLMEQLDVVFAKRYLHAYDDWYRNRPVTESWKKAFEISDQYWPIVLQHLLMGMNAHINLDLGIAANEVSRGKNMAELKDDFNRINEILSKLVYEVENDLSAVWPVLKYILKWSGNIDDYLVDFSMKLARNGAWKFAGQLALVSEDEIEGSIIQRDLRISNKVNLVLEPGLFATIALKLIRITERGSVSEKILKLKMKKPIT